MNNIRFIFRILRRSPLLLYINMPGLAIGLCTVLLLSVYLKHELSYDRHFANSNRVIRLYNTLFEANQTRSLSECLRTSYTQLPSQVPEVEKAVQLYQEGKTSVKTATRSVKDISIAFADKEFFDVFGISLLSGNQAEALAENKSAVLTKSAAERIFGTSDCLGEPLSYYNDTVFVTGIMNDLPETTHFRFDLLVPLPSYAFIVKQKSLEFNTYYLIRKGTDIELARKKIAVVNDNLMKAWKENSQLNNIRTESGTELLTKIHLFTIVDDDRVPKTDLRQLIIISGIALLVLVIALVNFLNMMVLHGEQRIREIASRKSLGANKSEIRKQFYLESSVLTLLSFGLAIVLAVVFEPFFARLLGQPLSLKELLTPSGLASIVLILIAVILLSGLYPGLLLSKTDLVTGLKGSKSNINRRSFSRAVVFVQFFITVLLLTSLLIIRSQVSFLKNIPLGFNPENVVVVQDYTYLMGRETEKITAELQKLPFVENVSAGEHIMGGGCSGQSIALFNSAEEVPVNEYREMPGFCETMQLKLKAGKYFDDRQSEKRLILLNESALKMLGLKFTDGMEVSYKGEPAIVDGVLKDFYSDGYPGTLINPIVIARSESNFGAVFYLRIKDDFSPQRRQQVAAMLQKMNPDFELSFTPLGDIYSAKFEKDNRIMNLVSAATVLAIVLCLVGMIALTVMNVSRRTKEIGIRKVLGSNEISIITSLLGETFAIVGIACIFGFALSYLLVERWLSHYVLKIQVGVGYFLLSGVFSLLLAFIAVSWQSWKAASRNPVEALRYE